MQNGPRPNSDVVRVILPATASKGTPIADQDFRLAKSADGCSGLRDFSCNSRAAWLSAANFFANCAQGLMSWHAALSRKERPGASSQLPRLGVPRVMTRPIWLASAACHGGPVLWSWFTHLGSTAQRTARPPIEWATMMTFPGPPAFFEVVARLVIQVAKHAPMWILVTHMVFQLE